MRLKATIKYKKLLALFFLSPFAYADMDTVCLIYFPESWVSDMEIEVKMIERKCERNNVLELNLGMDEFTAETLLQKSSKFCRFDRNTIIVKSTLSCILYSTRARDETS